MDSHIDISFVIWFKSDIVIFLEHMSLKDFEIVNKLGDGAYSTVYKVRRVEDGGIYALKRVKMGGLSGK